MCFFSSPKAPEPPAPALAPTAQELQLLETVHLCYKINMTRLHLSGVAAEKVLQ